MVKLSSVFMDGTYSRQRKAIFRKRERNRQLKQKQKGIDCDASANKQNSTDNIGFDKLSDDMLINILSRLRLKEAARTSVLSRRWTYLWMFAAGTLEFDDRDTATGTVMERKKFKSWFRPISTSTYRAIDSWIYFAMQTEAQRLALDFSPLGSYYFPNIDKLLSHSHEANSPFRSLRSLRLVRIDIEDEVVQYLLASCPQLAELSIRCSYVTKNLRVVDPIANLKVLEITDCLHIQSLEISAASLVSLICGGRRISFLLGKVPNIRELSIGEDLCDSFIYEPHKHSSYSVHLVKLVLDLCVLTDGRASIAPPDLPDLPQLCSLKRLELQVFSLVGRSLLFFTSLIKASPQLHGFKIEIDYIVESWFGEKERMPFPAVSAEDAVKFDHENLKVVEMAGYVGCLSEEEFLRNLFEIAPSLERVVINTESDYYENPRLGDLQDFRRIYDDDALPESAAATRIESKEHAEHLVSTFRPEIEFVII